MPESYPIEQLLTDMMAVIQQGTPYVVAAACLVGAVGFILAWFFYAIRGIVDWPFKK